MKQICSIFGCKIIVLLDMLTFSVRNPLATHLECVNRLL